MRPGKPCLFLPLALLACAPPPLPEDSGGAGAASGDPQVSWIFPENGLTDVCPVFVLAVDVENFEVVDFQENTEFIEGQGHLHFIDGITGDYITSLTPWAEWEADLNDQESRSYKMDVELVYNNHSPLTEANSLATVEFTVRDSEDCIGGRQHDTGSPDR